MKLTQTLAATGMALFASTTLAFAETPLRVAGNFSQNVRQVEIERNFFDSLGEAVGVDISMYYNPMDVVGVKAPDALRMLRGGSFDVMSVQVGMASRDDPFFEGIDLIGVAPDMETLRKVVDAYREPFDRRLQERFNAKVLTLWPFGPQVFFCNKPLENASDLRGLKVRSFTPSMSAMLESFGATPVTLQFSEVYPALQRGVASCGVTSPSSGNTGNWPEVTTHYLPLSVSGSVQGHFINLDAWNRFSTDEQEKLLAEFAKLEAEMWNLAINASSIADACNTGQDECTDYRKFSLQMVEVTDADRARLKEVAQNTVLPLWKQTCNSVDPQCSEIWNETAGAAAGLRIE